MSAAKRQRMLLGFGGLAVVLVAVIALVSPNFRSEDARGAIGAVQKHRAPQIAQSDVVLGDEQTKQEQQVLYGDFLKDAAALQNISADLAAESQSVEARAQLAAKSLDARHADLQARASLYAKHALDAMRNLAAKNQLAAADVESLSARASAQLEAADMEGLSASFAAMATQLEARDQLAAIESQLASFSLAAREQAALESMPDAAALESAFSADNLGLRLRAFAGSLEAMAKQSRSLEAASQTLQAKSLDAKALGRMSADFLKQAENLEARAVANMEFNLASHAESVEALGRMEQSLETANRSLEARASSLDARAAQAARSSLASFNRNLEVRRADMEARSSFGLRSQLAAMSSHLEARSAVSARSSLASAMPDTQNLAARARDLAARAELAARQR